MRTIFTFSLLSLLTISSSFAAIYNVTSEADSGAGTLRQAVNDAMANPGHDQVIVDRTSVNIITLTTRHNPIGFAYYLQTISNIDIIGNGAEIVSGTAELVMTIASSNVLFEDIIFKDFTDYVIRPTSNVTFQDCTFQDCIGSSWGAIWQRGGDLVMTNCTFDQCEGSQAGAIFVDFNSTSTVLTDMTFTDNVSTNNGGFGNSLTIQYDAQITLSGTCTFTGTLDQDIFYRQGGGELPDPSNTVTLNTFTLATGSVLKINQ